MVPKDVIKDLFYDFFFHEIRSDLCIPAIKTDTEILHVIRNINACTEFKSTKAFVKSILKGFLIEPLLRMNGSQGNSLNIEKHVLHISYNWFASLQRLYILSNSIDESFQLRIFGLTILDIYDICCVISLRTLLYTTATMRNSEVIWRCVSETLNKQKVDVWFRIEELNALCPSIPLEKLRIFMELFSVDLANITSKDDERFLYQCDDQYSIIFLDDFSCFVFSQIDNRIVDFLKTIGMEYLEQYKHQRGVSLEECTTSIMQNIYHEDVYSNMQYLDHESKRREIDVLVNQEKFLICVECKSSYFNLFEQMNDSETQMRVKGTFKRSLVSINAFYKTIKQGNPVTLRNSNKKTITISENKSLLPIHVTLYPIDIIGTQLHNIEKINIGEFDVYPININFMDFYMIMFLASANKQRFEMYLFKRYRSINSVPNLHLDVDEIDVFGFLTDPDYNSIYDHLLNHSNDIHTEFSITNGAYRRDLNSYISTYGLYIIMRNIVPTNIMEKIDAVFKMQ